MAKAIQEYTVGTLQVINDSILNADINSTAAIAFSKLAALPGTNLLVGNGSNVATAVALSGDATLANTGAITLANDRIVYFNSTPGSATYNTNSIQTLFTYTVPAGGLGTTNIYSFEHMFKLDNQSGTTQTFTLTLTYGTTAFATVTTGNMTNSANLSVCYVRGQLMALGATNSQMGWLEIIIGGRSLVYDLRNRA